MNGLSFILDTVRTNDKTILLQCGYKVKFSSKVKLTLNAPEKNVSVTKMDLR